MTIRNPLSRAKSFASSGITRQKNLWRSRMQLRNDEGALLVEVLVATLIMIIVFATTTLALASMGDKRVNIEQRDRALALVSSYEEKSRIYRCGFAVDRVDTNLNPTTLGTLAGRCDFAAEASPDIPKPASVNVGDQEFDRIEEINENHAKQTFHVSIRYWWELGGTSVHLDTCDKIANEKSLPIILTRAFRVTWKEKGVPRQEILIKRDPAPNDDVVFASGSRRNILVKPAVASGTYTLSIPEGAGTYRIDRIIKTVKAADPLDPSSQPEGDLGQPLRCIWYPYITADGGAARTPSGPGITSDPVDNSDLDDAGAQGSVKRS